MSRLCHLFLLLLATIAMATMVGSGPSRAETYYIGLSLSLEDEDDPEGREMQRAIDLLLKKVNEAGGVRGHRIEALVRDDGHDPNKARENAEAFAANDKVLAVIGYQFSSTALGATDVHAQRQLVAISPIAGATEVSASSPWFFSMNFDVGYQGRMLATWAAAVLDVRRVLVIGSETSYGRGLAEAFRRTAASLDVDVAGSVTVPETIDDTYPLDAVLDEAVEKADADAIALLTLETSGIRIVRALRKKGVDLPIVAPDAFSFDYVIEGLGGDKDKLTIAAPFLYELASLETLGFVREYKGTYPESLGAWPSPFVPFAYDAAQIVIEAIRQAGPDRVGIRTYLQTLGAPERAYEGIGGRVYFDEKGAAIRQAVFVHIAEGRFRPEFTQLKPVTQSHTLAAIAQGEGPDNVVMAGNLPLYRIQAVYAGLDPYRINNVDIREQRFDLEAFLWLRWQGELDTDRIGFVNEIFSEENVREELARESHGNQHYALFKIKSKFVATFDLHEFPFDRQGLDADLAHRTETADRLVLVKDAGRLTSDSLTAIYPAEWTFDGLDSYSGTYTVNSSFGREEIADAKGGPQFSVYATRINLQRILVPYIWTVFLPLAAMFCIGFLAFLIPASKFEARISLVTSALLSVLVFHLTQMSALPPVGYLIRIDQYFIAAYVTMLALIGMVIASDRFELSPRVERTVGLSLFGAVILANLVITILALLATS